MALFIVQNTNDSGAGSLRNAIAQSEANGVGADQIEFAAGLAGQTIALSSALQINSGTLSIDSDIDNDGDPDISLTGGTGGNVLDIDAASTVTLNIAVGNGFMLEAATGDDTLSGLGNATVMAGAGNDRVFNTNTAAGTGQFDGGAGTDTLDLSRNIALNPVIDLSTSTRFTGFENIIGRNDSSTGDTFTGTDGNNYMQGFAGDDVLNGKGGDDTINGGNGNDTITAFGNTSVGGPGDVISGGAGNDLIRNFYLVDGVGDWDGGAGNDTIDFSGDFTGAVSANVDLFSSTVYTNFENIIGVNNTAGFSDDLLGTNGDNEMNGMAGDDRLRGRDGDDTLDGGTGADTLEGGAGSDVYIVDNAGDRATETGLGFDIIRSTVTVNLTSNKFNGGFEAVTLEGGARINAIGNLLNNVLTGNDGKNVINGQAGADIMRGRGDADTYVIDNAGDVIDETLPGSFGFDRVLSSVNINLSNTSQVKGAIERIELTGTGNVAATGNLLANSVVGNTGNNIINGLNGNDILTGGDGNDSFFFTFDLGAGNVDTITDYVIADDRILLDDAIFTSLSVGVLSASNFRKFGTGPQDADDFILYNQANGAIYYDGSGPGGTPPQVFAVLAPGLAIEADAFLIV